MLMTTDQEPTDFEVAFQAGLEAHERGDHRTALTQRFEAYYAPDAPNFYDRGRAARDIAASFDRLGKTELDDRPYGTGLSNLDMAEAYAEYAYRDHKQFYFSMGRLAADRLHRNSGLVDMTYLSEQGAREFTVSAMYAAIIAARRNEGRQAERFINEGWLKSRQLYEHFGRNHQYDANMVSRVVGIRGFFGGEYVGKNNKLRPELVELSLASQTSALLGRDTKLSSAQVEQAQTKAIIRGLFALNVSRLQSLPTKRLTRPLSRYLLNRVVL
jgi:hypothetical protein